MEEQRMKRSISLILLACVLVSVALVSSVGASEDSVPSIFIGDGDWYKDAIHPLITRGGRDYIPVDVFGMFDYVSVTEPKADNILIHNTASGEYISILFSNRSAAVNGTIMSNMGIFIESETYYVDAEVVAEAIGVDFSSATTPGGRRIVRVSDDEAEYSLDDLIYLFLSIEDDYPEQITPPETDDKTEVGDDSAQKRIYVLCSQSDVGINKPQFSANEILRRYGLSYTMFIYDPSRIEDVIAASMQGEYGVYISYYGNKTVTDAVDAVNAAVKKVTNRLTRVTLDVYDGDSPDGYHVVTPDFTVNGVLSARYVYGQITEHFKTHDSCTLYLEDCWNSEQMIILLAGLNESEIITQNLAEGK